MVFATFFWVNSRQKNQLLNYLMVNRFVKEQFESLKNSTFEVGSELSKYFDLLRDFSPSANFFPTDRNNPTDDKTTTDISYRYFLYVGVLFRPGGLGRILR